MNKETKLDQVFQAHPIMALYLKGVDSYSPPLLPPPGPKPTGKVPPPIHGTQGPPSLIPIYCQLNGETSVFSLHLTLSHLCKMPRTLLAFGQQSLISEFLSPLQIPTNTCPRVPPLTIRKAALDSGSGHKLWNQPAWVRILAPAPTGCGSSGKFLKFSVLQILDLISVDESKTTSPCGRAKIAVLTALLSGWPLAGVWERRFQEGSHH